MRYMAPEIFKTQGEDQAYKEPLDMWAAGVIMYQLFAGKFPFNSPDLETKLLLKIQTCRQSDGITFHTMQKIFAGSCLKNILRLESRQMKRLSIPSSSSSENKR